KIGEDAARGFVERKICCRGARPGCERGICGNQEGGEPIREIEPRVRPGIGKRKGAALSVSGSNVETLGKSLRTRHSVRISQPGWPRIITEHFGEKGSHCEVLSRKDLGGNKIRC